MDTCHGRKPGFPWPLTASLSVAPRRSPAVAAALLELDVSELAALRDPGQAVDLLLRKPLEAWAAAAAAEPRVGSQEAKAVLASHSARAKGHALPWLLTKPCMKFASFASYAHVHLSPCQVVILIDALDEADPPAVPDGPTPAVPVCANRVLQLLASHLCSLPTWVRLLVTTRPDAASGNVISALDAALKGAGGVQHVDVSLLRFRAPGGSDAPRDLLVLRAVVQGCPEAVGPDAQPAAEAGGLAALHAAYERVFRAAAAAAAGSQPSAGAVEALVSRLPLDVRRLVDVLLAAQEPLPLSLLQQVGSLTN
jgi:hypothetical protein